MGRPERVYLRLEGTALSAEGQLFDYLNHVPGFGSRELVLRSLRAFYLPWAMAAHLEENQVRELARTAIEELQFRAFQIQKRFLPEEPLPSLVMGLPAPALPEVTAEASIATTVEEMHQEIDFARLNQILYDF